MRLVRTLLLGFFGITTGSAALAQGPTNASAASQASLAASGFVVAGSSELIRGSAVRVVAESVGHALYIGARLIAFVPNEIGRALIHHAVRDGTARK